MAGKRFAIFSLFGLLALALAVLATSGANAQSYTPGLTYTLSDTTAGVASDTTTTFSIPAPDYNYGDASMVNFSPPDGWTEVGTVIPIADEVGTLFSTVRVGLLGGPCTTPLPPSFTLENASVDTSDELSPADMYWVLKDKDDYPVPYTGKGDVLIPDYLEAYPHFINEMLDPDGVGPLLPLQPRARYAGYTTVANISILVQFVLLSPGQLSQLGGIYAQMGANIGHPTVVVLNNPISGDAEPGPLSDFCTPLATSTTLLGTTVANQYTATGGGITARTNPPSNTGVLGTGTHMSRNYSQSERDADGDGIENDLDPCPYTADPLWDPRGGFGPIPGDADGDHLPDSCDPTPAVGNIDEDGDGYDNGQDNCPLVPNGCEEAACSAAFPPIYDPTWDNQADSDSQQPSANLGPGPDSIGDACDDSDDDGLEDFGLGGGTTPGTGDCDDGIDNDFDALVDGNDPDCQPYMDKDDLSPWGANPGTGLFYHAMPWAAVTINAAVDTDGDGYSDSLEGILGSNPGLSGSTPESLVIDMTITVGAGGLPAPEVAQSCNDGVDNDGDTLIDAADNSDLGCDPSDDSYGGDADYDGVPDGTDNCPAVKNPEQTDTDDDGEGDACDPDTWGPDADNDGFDNDIELYLGTDPWDNCSDVPGSHDAWPLDMNMSQDITIAGDILPYAGKIGLLDTDPAWDATVQRLDLNADGAVSAVADVFGFYLGMIPSSCNGGTPHPPSLPEGTPITMGIDPEITGNNASTLGDLEACVRADVDPGDFGDGTADYTIDVYVTGDSPPPAPSGYDAWLIYYADRVDPVSWDDLIKLPGATSYTRKRGDVSRLDAAAVYLSGGSGTAGDGTIVRIDLDVISAGAACFGFGFAKAYASDANHPTVPKAASLAINTDCATGDSDGDGIIDMCDNCRNLSNPGQEDLDGDRWGDDCDYCLTTPTPWFTPPGDEDCDGSSSAVEGYLGTDPLDACPDWPGTQLPDPLCPGPTCDGDDVWPLDNNVDTYVTTVGDVLNYAGNMGKDVATYPELLRLDLSADGFITTVGDVLMYAGNMGVSCA